MNSDDPSYRMPKGHAPLRPDEQQLLQAWLAQGSTWPDEQIAGWNNRREPFSHWLLGPARHTLNGRTAEVPFVRGMFVLGCWEWS